MLQRIASIVTMALTAMGIAVAPAAANPTNQTRIGTLSCHVSPGEGLLIESQKSVACTFAPVGYGSQEHYTGTISKLGIDIGATNGGDLVWAVIAPTDRAAGALAGTFVGATGQATIGEGVGLNVLVGGSSRTIELQPLSVSAQTGLNLAVGVGSLQLSPSA
jgi:hypothetical protein